MGVGIEVPANQSGNGEIKWEGEEGIERMCVGRDVVIKRKKTEMKGGRSNVNSNRVIGSEGGDGGEGAGTGEVSAIEDRDTRSGIRDGREGGGRRKKAFPSRVARGPLRHNPFRVRVRDGGDKPAPWWFLNEENISGGQLKNTFHGCRLFVDISGEDNEGEGVEGLFRHRVRNLRILRKFA
jgi:hypothetical protein